MVIIKKNVLFKVESSMTRRRLSQYCDGGGEKYHDCLRYENTFNIRWQNKLNSTSLKKTMDGGGDKCHDGLLI
jgi:hypothetical protein